MVFGITSPRLGKSPLRLVRSVALALCSVLVFSALALAQADPLPSWNDGPAKQAILAFVKATTDASNPDYVPPGARIATFDQDGTTWAEQPLYPQMLYCLQRVPALVQQKPELKDVEPFRTVLSGDRKALAALTLEDLEKLQLATLTGMSLEEFKAEAGKWIETARHPRWNRPYTELVYQPMLEVLRLFRDNGYKTYFVTGGWQEFVRIYSERVYGIPPEQVVGSVGGTGFGYDANGKPTLRAEPRLLLIDDNEGKPSGIQLMIGRCPVAAFGNSRGDKEMLEYAQSGGGRRLMVLVHHDDAQREYAYGPESKIGTFPDSLMSQANQNGWLVVSMRKDWKRVFPWE